MSSILAGLKRERALLTLSAWGLAQAAAVAVAIGVRGSAVVVPEGNLWRPATGALALAIFVLGTVVLLQVITLPERERGPFRAALLAAVAYGLVFELRQAAVGLDPRFSLHGTFLNLFLRYSFLATSQVYVLLYGVLGWHLWRRPPADALRALWARYALASAAVGFAAGYALIARWWAVPFTPRAHDLVLAHMVGMDGVEAAILLGALAQWRLASSARARALVHAGGAAWLAAAVLLLVSAVVASPALKTLALAFLPVWAVAALTAFAARRWRVPATAAP